TVTVRPGDTLARIFADLGYTAADVHAVVNSSKDARKLADLRPQQVLAFVRGDDGALLRVDYPLDEGRLLRVARTGDGYATEVVERPVERRVVFAEGTIDSSLFLAGR